MRASRRPAIVLALVALLSPPLAGCFGDAPSPAHPSQPIPGPRPSMRPPAIEGSDRAEISGEASGGFSNTSVFPGDYEPTRFHSQPLEPGPYGLLPPEVLTLESPVDGVALEVALVRPDTPEGVRVPVIVDAGPYYQAFDPEKMTTPDDLGMVRQSLAYEYYARTFGPHGYAIALVAIRGSGGSGGCSDLFGPLERADLSHVVTWLGTREWSNGNVGMIGASYDGTTPWEVAATGNPHLKTIVPMAGVPDLHSILFRNGTAHWTAPGLLASGYYGLWGFGANNPATGRDAERTLANVVCPEAWARIARDAQATAAPERDAFFEARDQRPGVEESYRGSVFLVHGLQDHRVAPANAYPWVQELEDRGVVVKHLLGQWDHTLPDLFHVPEGTRRVDFQEVLLHWFDYWLKEDRTVDLGPRVQVQDSLGRWRDETTWPPRDARPVTFHLNPDGALAAHASNRTSEALVGPAGGPVLASAASILGASVGLSTLGIEEAAPCPGCPRFETAPFEEAFRFAGLPTLPLNVTPLGPQASLTALLYVGDETGEKLVGRASLDLRYAHDGDTPHPVAPGARMLAPLQFQPLDVTVPAGSQLTLVLTQGAPEEELPGAPNAPLTVHLGQEASRLIVHAFERDEDAFFEPPEVV